MDTNKKKRLISFFNIETIIIIAIAACMLFLNTFTVKKLNELEVARNNAVFLLDEIEFPDQEEFTEEMKSYLNDSYKMIELYDENFELLFQIQFVDNYKTKGDLINQKDLVSILKNNKEGQTTINIGDSEEDVYFKWITNSRGEERLLLVYSTIKNVRGLWVFSFICWLVLILVFILVIRLHSKNYTEKIEQYKSMTNNFL